MGLPTRQFQTSYYVLVLADLWRQIRRPGGGAGSDPVDTVEPDGDRWSDRLLSEIERVGDEWQQHPSRNRRINRQIRSALAGAGITGGRVLEIGARKNPRLGLFGDEPWQYSIMDIASHTQGLDTIIGDITSCPELDDRSFDVIISVDVLEHVNRPWLAASEISRLLRPGGISYTSTLFAWRYHPVPIDYWRFSPACLEFLFRRPDHGRGRLRYDRTEVRHPRERHA